MTQTYQLKTLTNSDLSLLLFAQDLNGVNFICCQNKHHIFTRYCITCHVTQWQNKTTCRCVNESVLYIHYIHFQPYYYMHCIICLFSTPVRKAFKHHCVMSIYIVFHAVLTYIVLGVTLWWLFCICYGAFRPFNVWFTQ